MNFKTWLHAQLERDPPRGKSLIVTLLGDALSRRSSGAWLSEFIVISAPFGLNERLVRTSIFRLAEEGWLEAVRHGRRSYYTITRIGLSRISHADRRIYEPPQKNWDGKWTLVISLRGGGETPNRMELRKELEWEGYGQLASGIHVHPATNREGLEELVQRFGMQDAVVIMESRDIGELSRYGLAQTVNTCWPLAEISARYEHFLNAFTPLQKWLEGGASVTDDQAFMIRTFLIHTYRRASLHDPQLPLPMLPENWAGIRAFNCCRDIYAHVHRPSERYLRKALGNVAPSDQRNTQPVALRRFASA
jgi:phenylacetic acid degradation operon negative regulatory protein